MAKKILIMYATAGAGHKAAADALEQAAHKYFPELEVLNVDALDYTNLLHKKVYAQSWLSIINYMPNFWGYLYNQLDQQHKAKLANQLLTFFDKVNAQKLFTLVKEYRPDQILCTHFLSAELLNSQPDGRKLSVVVTDYDVHRFWVYDSVQHYFVASNEVRHMLRHKGVNPEKVSVTGIPVRQQFLEKFDRLELIKKWQVSPNHKTLLMMSGGYGVGGVTEIVKTLFNVPHHFNLIVVTGKNEKLARDLQKLDAPGRVHFQVLGFVEEIPELMEVADFLITKSGALTLTEALVKGLPMVLTDPMPGQEGRNADFMIENGAAVKAHSLISLESKVSRLLEHPHLLDQMYHRALEAARPHAARHIIETLQKL